jgi:hypothetical protein
VRNDQPRLEQVELSEFTLIGTSMSAIKLSATINIWPSHWGTLEPVVPEIEKRLGLGVVRFKSGGPLGHTMRPVLLLIGRCTGIRGKRVLILPQGEIPASDWVVEGDGVPGRVSRSS